MKLQRVWNLAKALHHDDSGSIIAVEYLMVSTVLVFGLIVGLGAVRDAVVDQMGEMSSAIGGLSMSYSIGGVQGCCSHSSGSEHQGFRRFGSPVRSTCAPIQDPITFGACGGD